MKGLFYELPLLYKDKSKRYPSSNYGSINMQSTRDVILKSEKPDIVHSHGSLIHSFLPLKKKYNIPLIATLHGYELFCPKKSLFNNQGQICVKPFTSGCIKCSAETFGLVKAFSAYCALNLEKRSMRLVDKYIAVSSFVKQEHIKNLHLDNEKIVVIPNFYGF